MFEAAPHPAHLKIAIAALAAIAGLLFVALHFRAQARARRALDWPVTPGIVTASRTARRWGFGSGIWVAGLWYVPDITYRYEVAGKSFTRTGAFLTETGFSKRRQAQEIIDRYPVGAGVGVHYDPDKPKRACLDAAHRERRALGTAGLLFAIAAAALVTG